MKNAKELANFLIIQNSSLSSSYPDVRTAFLMFLTVPVTTAKAERTFSKLKLIKNYLRSSMGQDRLTNLAILSIENQRARKVDTNKIIDEFAMMKSRKKRF